MRRRNDRRTKSPDTAGKIFGTKVRDDAVARLTGFYSYGEVSPCSPDAPCEPHNQTMTITTPER